MHNLYALAFMLSLVTVIMLACAMTDPNVRVRARRWPAIRTWGALYLGACVLIGYGVLMSPN